MFLVGSGSHWKVRAPAKLNLLLEVVGQRDDGFHEVETLMVPITLFDSIHFRGTPAGPIRLISVDASERGVCSSNKETLPEEDGNIVVRAVQLLRARSRTTRGAVIQLVKRIPLSAGLGGGSSDAAAALAVANRAWRLNWNRQRLSDLGAELGSDVPFFLASAAAICRGRGERVERLDRAARLHVVVVHPPEGLSTQRVFQVCQPAAKPEPVEPMVDALRRGRLADVGRLLTNRLEEAASRLSSWVVRVKREFERLDCLGSQMTGSGTSCFGLCRSARHARRVAAVLRCRAVGRVRAAASCHQNIPGS